MAGFLWERYTTDGALNDNYARAGGALARIRRGAKSDPGCAPEMWPYYSRLNPQGNLTVQLRAEHACLAAYAHHQQGKSFPVHRPGTGIGEAARAVRFSSKFMEDAVDEHFMRLATATQLSETTWHLISLVGLMRATKQPIGFDYSKLFDDLCDLQSELAAPVIRRRWGAAYFRPQSETAEKE